MTVDHRLALHEAGHALAGILTGVPIIEAKANSKEGYVRLDISGPVPPVILAAGCAAEQLGYGDYKVSSTDLRELAWHANRAVTFGRDLMAPTTQAVEEKRWMRERVREAANLLRPHTDALDAIYKALHEHGALTGKQIEDIASGGCGCSHRSAKSRKATKLSEITADDFADAIHHARHLYAKELEKACERGHEGACVAIAGRGGIRTLSEHTRAMKRLGVKSILPATAAEWKQQQEVMHEEYMQALARECDRGKTAACTRVHR